MSRSEQLRDTSGLNDRAQQLLRVLIQKYISEGDPIGSRALARDSGLDLSPATVRNVMADLEDLGLVHAPHTSAGRVPTLKGYRMFVDSLLVVDPMKFSEVANLQERLTAQLERQDALESASYLLSECTRMASLVTVPRRTALTLRQIEFIQLTDNRVLVVLLSSNDEVQNRIIYTERRFGASELQQAARYLTEQFGGKELSQVRSMLLRQMREDREHMDSMMNAALEVAEQAFGPVDEEDEEDLVIAGETRLMDFSDLSDMQRLRSLFDAFNQKRDILHLLDQCIGANGVKVFIGEESGYQVLDNCSLVTAPYTVSDRVIGVLGVIGPTRMDYQRVIPMVDVTAKLLSAALNQR